MVRWILNEKQYTLNGRTGGVESPGGLRLVRRLLVVQCSLMIDTATVNSGGGFDLTGESACAMI